MHRNSGGGTNSYSGYSYINVNILEEEFEIRKREIKGYYTSLAEIQGIGIYESPNNKFVVVKGFRGEHYLVSK